MVLMEQCYLSVLSSSVQCDGQEAGRAFDALG